MRPNRSAVPWLVFALTGQPAASARSAPPGAAPAPQSSQIPTFGVGTAAVTLDVVVRDKKGKALRDLQASDFEVYEDGVKQRVETFEVFGRPLGEPEAADTKAPAPAPPAPAIPAPRPAATPADLETRPQVIAFVFDRLSPNARNIAQKAAMTYVEHGHVPGDLVGVFTIDLALRTIQPFTSDLELVRAAITRAASQANTEFASDRARMRDLADVISAGQHAAESATGANPGQGGQSPGGAAAAGALNQAVATIQLRMVSAYNALERDQQGYASTNGLLAVVSGLKGLPGRKTVVFFSEGLAIPTNVQAQFRSVIHAANRANVSVYAMDAGGLRAESMNAETRNEMRQANARRLRQLESGQDDGTTGPMISALERNEDLLRLNPEAGLGQLASETGGFLIRDTNDAASAFRRIEEDMRFHYLLGYSPSNENYDGRFRSISVKVNRPGVEVQTRQGYYAIRAAESAPLRSFEAPALVELDRQPRPHEFPIETTALSFPTPKRPGLVPVLVHVPANTVTYAPDKEDRSGKKIHRADFTVVARVKNESGQEVDRLAQHYALSAAASSLEAARRRDILFYREADLAPGRYTIEAVVYDAVARKASVRTTTLEVPAPEDGRALLSSVVLVGRAEKVATGETRPDSPLLYGDALLYPNMGASFRTSTALGFFFTVSGLKDGTAPKATIEVYRGDQAAGKVTTDLPPPDATGRVQYAGSLPLQNFPVGSYSLRVTAIAGEASATRQASFTVSE